MYKFGTKSVERLQGVHIDLVGVMEESIKSSPYDFSITEGLRSPERQQALYDQGKSRTLNSRHLTGHAVDFAVIKDGKVVWDFPLYEAVGQHIKKVAASMSIPIIWGGEWRGLVDGPHIELDRKVYE